MGNEEIIFNVGDTVVIESDSLSGRKNYSVGKVVRITPKKGEIVVKRGSVEYRFERTGRLYHYCGSTRIMPATEENCQKVRDEKDINRCYKWFQSSDNPRLSADKARRIIAILVEGETT